MHTMNYLLSDKKEINDTCNVTDEKCTVLSQSKAQDYKFYDLIYMTFQKKQNYWDNK